MSGDGLSLLLELSQDHGGSITFDATGEMRTLKGRHVWHAPLERKSMQGVTGYCTALV